MANKLVIHFEFLFFSVSWPIHRPFKDIGAVDFREDGEIRGTD